MYIKDFNSDGIATIKISESEINALSNALYEYFEVYKPKKSDKGLRTIRTDLYIIYEIVHHNGAFDNVSLDIIKKMRAEENK